MKRFLFPLVLLFYFIPSADAQEIYVVGGKTYQLRKAVDGDLELLWNVMDRRYHYFLKNGDKIVELKNTNEGGGYQEEYKQVLLENTSDYAASTERLGLTLADLRSFLVGYNSYKDPDYVGEMPKAEVQFWVGAFAGMTNSVYTENSNNEKQPMYGVELEMVEPIVLKRHGIVLGFRHTMEGNEHIYSLTQLALSYRFKFIKSHKFDMFINTTVASLSFYKKEIFNTYDNEIIKESGKGFFTPMTFGMGANYKVGEGYITLKYHDIVALNLNSSDRFPFDLSLGYQFLL